MPRVDIKSIKLDEKRPAAVQIYEYLRRLITNTTIEPGSALSENALSSLFNVSRQPVREALMHLKKDGLIDVLPQRGSIVKTISVSDLIQVCFVRNAIEGACIASAQELGEKAFLKIMASIDKIIVKQKAAVKSGDSALFLQLDDAFHENICSFSQCALSWSVIEDIKGQLDRIRYLSMNHENPMQDLMHEHEAIACALRERNYVKASQLMTSHVQQVLKTHVRVKQSNSSYFCDE